MKAVLSHRGQFVLLQTLSQILWSWDYYTVSIGEGLKYPRQYCSLTEMTVYEGRILVTFKEGLEEQLIYLALRSIGKHIREQKEVSGIELFLKPTDWVEVTP